ncbi:MAG: cupin domain-containing protein [Chloroflexota bacterium]
MGESIMRFDLEPELAQLREQPAYGTGAPTGKTLVKQRDLRIVLMTLQAGGRLEKHHASGPISIQALAGRFRLQLPGETVDLERGQLLALDPGVYHDVEAIDNCAFLLTLGRTHYVDVSEHHEPEAHAD